MPTAEQAPLLAGLPPGCGLPRSRQTARWIGRPVKFLQGLQEEHGDVFTVHLLQEDPWVMVSDPELVKQVFTAPADVLHAGEPKRILEPIIGPTSVLLNDEARHMRQRKLLLPPFHGSRMERYGAVMREVAEAEIDGWPIGEAGPAAPRLAAITLEVILRTVFGVDERENLDPLRAALAELVGYASDQARVALVALGDSDRLADERFGEFRALIDRTDELVLAEIARHRGDAALADRDDVLSMLMRARHEDGSPMTDAELRDELTTLVVAGYETTASSLAWALERLTRHPEALARTVAEADAGGGPYTDAVLYETLRLRPVLPIVARLVKQPFRLGEYTIPVGATVMPSVTLVHRRPDVYPDPDAFRPERFLDRPPGTYTWIPFGGGVRRCIGAAFSMFEMRIVLSTLLRRATIRAADPEPELPKRRLLVLPPSRGADIILEPR